MTFSTVICVVTAINTVPRSCVVLTLRSFFSLADILGFVAGRPFAVGAADVWGAAREEDSNCVASGSGLGVGSRASGCAGC
jgi:hypothetical protein